MDGFSTRRFGHAGFGHDFPSEKSAGEAERQIDIEDPAPADAVDQKAAERRAGEKADMKRGRCEPEGAAPLFHRQVDRHDGAAVGRDHRTADRLHGAEKNQLAGGLGQAADRRSGDENQKTEGVKTAPAEQIAKPAHGDDQTDQNQIVNQDRPLDGREWRCQKSLPRSAGRR